MPPLGSSVVHSEAVELIEAWIRDDLANYKTFENWIAGFDIANKERTGDPDADGASNYLEYLVGTDPGNDGDGFRISITHDEGKGTITFPQKANRGYEVSAAARIGAGWRTLDFPANNPFFSATNRTGSVDFLLHPDQNAFMRVRVFEP